MAPVIPVLEVSQDTKSAILEAQVNAAMDGHDLGPFEPVDTRIGGYQAQCRQCGQTVWVGEYGLMYSLLGDRCNVLRV